MNPGRLKDSGQEPAGARAERAGRHDQHAAGHAVFTNPPFTLIQAEAQHCGHAIVESPRPHGHQQPPGRPPAGIPDQEPVDKPQKSERQESHTHQQPQDHDLRAAARKRSPVFRRWIEGQA